MTIKAGFTLIEVVVVMAIFGFLAVVATNFLLATVSTNTRITIENEVRQNAVKVMEDISAEVRRASCVSVDGNVLTISNAPAADPCTGTAVEFDFTDGVVKKNGQTLTSGKVKFCTNNPACDVDCAAGVTAFVTAGSLDITLKARQANITSRIDSCARVVLTNTVTPRNVGN